MIEVSQLEIKQIYDKAMIRRTQMELDREKILKEKMEKDFWGYLQIRLRNMVQNIMGMYTDPKIPNDKVLEAQKEFSEFLKMVNMHTLPEVIEELIRRETKHQYVVKMK